MKLLLLGVGTPTERWMDEAILEYERRVSRYFRFESVHVPAGAGPRARPGEIRRREAERLRSRLPDHLETWCLTREGKQISSVELARELADMRTYSRPGVVFLIGGAHGLDGALRDGCTRSLSLSRMTLPHDMARLLLTEQLYRAGSLLRGEPYHKGGPE
jgi:23S rRNA (pseudouridine1915-N3)-methyltransferase